MNISVMFDSVVTEKAYTYLSSTFFCSISCTKESFHSRTGDSKTCEDQPPSTGDLCLHIVLSNFLAWDFYLSKISNSYVTRLNNWRRLARRAQTIR